MVDEKGPHQFVMFQNPGPTWIDGIPYNEQPDFPKHVAFVNALHDAGQVILSGPFMKKAGGLAGELADGGMTVFKAADLEEATRIAEEDPTVKSGMLTVEVKMLWAPFHN